MPPFLCHPQKILKFLCHPVLCHPWNFYASPFYATPQIWNVYATLFYATLNISVFQRINQTQKGISTFLVHFFHNLYFFYATHFYATLKIIEIFMPPPFYATLEYLMPPFLCHPGGGIKKRGGGIKKKPMAGWVGGGVGGDILPPSIFLIFRYVNKHSVLVINPV